MAVWTVFLSLCLLVALSPSEESAHVGIRRCGACWAGWTPFGCRCFKFFSNQHTWIEAERTCMDFDGNLASVHSLEEHTFIKKLANNTRSWIGGHDAVHEGVWLWSDGSKMIYQIWSPGNPSNDYGNQHCLETNYDYDTARNWNDDKCTVRKSFLCAN